MDEVAKYNRARWEGLVEANALFTRPYLDLTPDAARARLDPEGRLPDVRGQRVLCLASGGGQQSVAFAILGAAVTVLDLSEGQLGRDRDAAGRLSLEIRTVAGDMRDLSVFPPDSFDLVWHPYSLNFVPDARLVFAQVARVLRSGGLYRFTCANPFVAGMTEADWNGDGYALRRPYVEGEALTYADAPWVYRAEGGRTDPVPSPREYRHRLGTLVNGLIASGFQVEYLSERVDVHPDPGAPPATWDHFTAFAPPWLAFWASRR